jgi:hypothetical protein
MDFNRIQELNRIMSARSAGLPLDYLRRKWTGPYNPRKHLFNESGAPIWFVDEDGETWRKVGKCYCDWYGIPEHERIKFWLEIASLMPLKK